MPASDLCAVVAGASGLVGGHALELLMRSPFYRQVVVITRRRLEVESNADHELSQRVVTDFAQLASHPAVPARVALCGLGTTLKAAGSREAFQAVDLEAVAAFARWARKGGATTFVLVSSVGADPEARNFYLRTKGEAESAVADIGFPRFVALRPGLLLGERAESRRGEAIGRALMPLVNRLLGGSLRRYRGVAARTVAAALVSAAEGAAAGRFVWHHDQILDQAQTVLKAAHITADA